MFAARFQIDMPAVDFSWSDSGLTNPLDGTFLTLDTYGVTITSLATTNR